MSQAGRYIFRQLFWWTVFVTVCLTCVVWLTQSLRFVEMIVNRGLSAPVFLYLTSLLLPTFIALILPIALFTGVMFAYNRMIVDSELVILRASGLSQFALARPALALAVLVTLVSYGLSFFFIPASYRAFKELQFFLRNSYSTVLLQEGVFNPIMKGVTVFVRNRSADGQLYGIVVHDNRNPKRPVTMMAQRGVIVAGEQGPRVVMENGNRQEVRGKDGRLSLLYFDRYTFELTGLLESNNERWREPRERYMSELFFPDEMESEVWSYHELRMEGYHRLASPLLSIAFALTGLAFLLSGEFNRRGQMKRIVFAVIAIVAIEAIVLGAKSFGVKAPAFAPAIYLGVLLPIVVASYVLLFNPVWTRRKSRAAPAV